LEQNGTHGASDLSERQIKVLPYLVVSRTRSEAAKLADIGRTTLHNWMNDPCFRRELERFRNEALELAYTELKGLALKAAQVVGDALEDSSPNVRLRAAQIALTIGLKVNELREIEQRLDRLDDALPLWASRNGKW